ncbi:MAG: GNAT family N-acetyltransferase [Bacteroidia bacterium]|nr:GNAT family N-acetyltransferase [Bacteroidia bacterium]
MLHLQFTPFPFLETERLNLRELREDDAQEVFIQRSHPVINKYIKRELAKSEADALDWIRKQLERQLRSEGILWAISLENTSRLIGSACFWNIEPEKEKAELGYSLHYDYFNCGIMSEALVPIIDYGFNVMKLKCIDAYTNKDNAASRRILEKIGFKRNIPFENEFVSKEELEYNVVYTLDSRTKSQEAIRY